MNRFQGSALIVLMLSLVAHFFVVMGVISSWILLVSNIGGIGLIALAALNEFRRTDSAFDLTVAAETLVAFGVLSLILGVVVALAPLVMADGQGLVLDEATLRQLGFPFLQGLATAGIAPVMAVILRNWSSGDELDLAAQLANLAGQVANFSAELEAAAQNVADFNNRIGQIVMPLTQIGPALAAQVSAFDAATNRIVGSIDGNMGKLEQSLSTGGSRLVATLDRTGLDLDRVASGYGGKLTTLIQATEGSAASITQLDNAMIRLSAKAEGTTELLEALGVMIASVERFVVMREARA